MGVRLSGCVILGESLPLSGSLFFLCRVRRSLDLVSSFLCTSECEVAQGPVQTVCMWWGGGEGCGAGLGERERGIEKGREETGNKRGMGGLEERERRRELRRERD